MFSYKNAIIIGLGISGKSAAHFLLKQHIQVSAVDKNADTLKKESEVHTLINKGLKLYSETDALNLYSYDIAIVSPGVPPSHPIYQKVIEAGIEVIGEIELACRFLHQTCFGITGSNGKTTTVLLTEHILKNSGKKAKAVGNVGTPLTSILNDDSIEETLIIELSSWQLETLHSPVLDAALILNITPNHLDRHITMEAYAKAKFQILHCLKEKKNLFLHYKTFIQFNELLKSNKNIVTFGYEPQADLHCDQQTLRMNQSSLLTLPDSLKNKESHEVENLMGAFLLCHEAGISSDDFIHAYSSFKKPPHRIEFVRKFNEVSYYDDSKATSIDAVMKAVNFLEGKIVLIAGGVHKGGSYTPWIDGFKDKVRSICAIGEAAVQIKNEISNHINVIMCLNLEEALHYAAKKASPGDTVLLSPGCSSFDMFKDYKQRGEIFKQLVNDLK